MSSSPVRALLEVVGILEALAIDYAIGGSVASSVFGEPRASADADLLVALEDRHVDALVGQMEGAFYISRDAARDAVRRGSSFNVIHLDSMYKIDLFVAGRGALDQEQLARGRAVALTEDPDRLVKVTAPANIVLRKLDWYRQGGGVSDQQWRDVLGVLKVQAATLDLDYMRELADRAGLSELLVRALGDAGIA